MPTSATGASIEVPPTVTGSGRVTPHEAPQMPADEPISRDEIERQVQIAKDALAIVIRGRIVHTFPAAFNVLALVSNASGILYVATDLIRDNINAERHARSRPALKPQRGYTPIVSSADIANELASDPEYSAWVETTNAPKPSEA